MLTQRCSLTLLYKICKSYNMQSWITQADVYSVSNHTYHKQYSKMSHFGLGKKGLIGTNIPFGCQNMLQYEGIY